MGQKSAEDVAAVVQKIDQLPAFRDIARRLHEIISESVPELQPRLWYGMPGYAKAKSKPVIVFFRVDGEDVVTLGTTEKADLTPEDDAPDRLIESAWFLTELDGPTEERISTIVRKAAR